MRRQMDRGILALLLCLSTTVPAAFGQCDTRLTASDTLGYGYSSAVEDNVLVVGARREHSPGASEMGAAYIYQYDGNDWIEVQRLTPSDGQDAAFFGTSCAISNGVIFVGSTGAEIGGKFAQGAVYVFEFDGVAWRETLKLTASDGEAGDVFGSSCAAHGDAIAIGAKQDDAPQTKQGSGYIFRHNGTTWVEEAKLTFHGSYNYFGTSCALSENVAVFGATGANGNAGDRHGAAFVFRFDGTSWNQEAELQPGSNSVEFFGVSCAVEGDVVVVGGDRSDNSRGNAWVYRFDGAAWVKEKKLEPNARKNNQHFGRSCSILDSRIVVGAPGDNFAGYSNCGAMFVFEHNGNRWKETEVLRSSTLRANENIGISCAQTGSTILAGALKEFSGPDAAYVFSRLSLTTSAETAVAGDTLEFESSFGTAGSPVLLAVVSVNGAAWFYRLEIGSFAPDGRHLLAPIVPPGLTGLTLGLQSYGMGVCEQLEASNVVTVSIQ